VHNGYQRRTVRSLEMNGISEVEVMNLDKASWYLDVTQGVKYSSRQKRAWK
jgi:hypothetical protein